jgi:hypothetical protein
MSASAEISSINISKEQLDILINNELSRRISKAKWVATTNLLSSLCWHGGVIYGGAVRTYIQRVSAAKKYYAFCQDNHVDADDNYCNKNIHPQSYEDRNIFPADIDVFINESKFTSFMSDIGKDYNLKKKNTGGAKYFFESNELFKKTLKLEKYRGNFINFSDSVLSDIILRSSRTNSVKVECNLDIKIDFVIIKDEYSKYRDELSILYPPFGNPDFDVNLLCFRTDMSDAEGDLTIKPLPILKKLLVQRWYSSDTYYLKFKPLEEYTITKTIMDDIITNIIEKRARPVFPDLEDYYRVFGKDKMVAIDHHRTEKILSRGYKIDKWNLIISKMLESKIIWAPSDYNYETGSDLEDQDKCVICYDTFSKDNRWFKCCKQCTCKMHQTCMSRYLKSIRLSHEGVDCPNCRTLITNVDCPCKFITFFNAIDYVINALAKKKCSDCSRFIRTNTLRSCECNTIDCRCKLLIGSNIYDID